MPFDRQSNTCSAGFDVMRWHVGLIIVAVLPGSALAENEFRDCEMGGDWRRRVAACTYVLQNRSTAPEQAKAYENRAAAHNRGNYMDNAVADITRAIELEPNTRRTRERGWYVYQTEDYKKALTDLDTAVAADPADLFIRGVRVDTLLKLKDAGRALVALDEWISRAPEDWEARAKRAKLNIAQKNWAQALPDLDKVIALRPDYQFSFLQRAEVNFKIGAKDKALADITRYIELDPDETGGYFNRGLMYENLGNMSAAIADYDALLRLKPDDSWALDRREKLIAKYGRTDAPSSPAKATETKAAAPPTSAPPAKEADADQPRECRSFVPAANVIVPVPCMD